MAKSLDPEEAGIAREDARRLEAGASTGEPYPEGTVISRSNPASRMFNVRLSEEQFVAIQTAAERQHLPMSTMARAWLLDRLEQEQRAS